MFTPSSSPYTPIIHGFLPPIAEPLQYDLFITPNAEEGPFLNINLTLHEDVLASISLPVEDLRILRDFTNNFIDPDKMYEHPSRDEFLTGSELISSVKKLINLFGETFPYYSNLYHQLLQNTDPLLTEATLEENKPDPETYKPVAFYSQ